MQQFTISLYYILFICFDLLLSLFFYLLDLSSDIRIPLMWKDSEYFKNKRGEFD